MGLWTMTTITNVTVLGLVAAFCTTAAYLPQVVKTWRTRSTTDISLGMFLLMVSGLVLWLAYGIMLADLPLIASNTVTLILAAAILYLKVRHG
jgi:MtN3 and saliva related transmembrane protein